jgi:hypothetical protein
LYFYNARYYDPLVGQFTQPDSLVADPMNPAAWNRFSYVHGNPTNLVDPTGHIPVWDILDVASFGMSLYDFANKPTLGNLGWLALDTVGLLPLIPSVGVARRGLSALGDAENAVTSVRRIDNALEPTAIAMHGHRSGQAFAFGQGPRSQRAIEMVTEAGRASGINVTRYVDAVAYNPSGVSSFFVDAQGRRIIAIGSSAFRRTKAGQIIEATHELVHAKQFDILVRKYGGDVGAAADQFKSLRFGSPEYAFREAVTERAALQRVERYFGGLSPQQRAASIRYINDWRGAYLYGRLP